MFMLVQREVKNGITVNYIVKNVKDGVLTKCNTMQFKTLVANRCVLNVYMKSNRLCGKGLRCPVSKVKVTVCDKNKKRNSVLQNISMFTGSALQNYVQVALSDIKKARSEVIEVMRGLKHTQYRITVLTGTRRTGKTILSLQAIKNLASQGVKYKDICFMQINTEIDIAVFYKFLVDNCTDIRYIVVDEITRCRNFIDYASVLSDQFCFSGCTHRLLLTGTDSFVFSEANRTTLFGRAYIINTTLLKYKDYVNLFGKDFSSYFKFANMMEKYNLDFETDVAELMSLTFCSNISTSILRNPGRNFWDLQGLDVVELRYYIYQILVKEYAVSLSAGHINGNTIDTPNKKLRRLITKQVEADVYKELMQDKRVPNRIKDSCLISIYEALRTLGVIYSIRNIYSNDINYATNDISVEYEGPTNDRMYIVAIPAVCYAIITRYNQELKRKANKQNLQIKGNDNNGHLLENAIIANLLALRYNVRFYRDPNGNEIDCVVYTDTYVYLMEIKSSTNVKADFVKHLKNEQVCNECYIGYENCKLQKYVLYMGENCTHAGIDYVNISDFLLNVEKYLLR